MLLIAAGIAVALTGCPDNTQLTSKLDRPADPLPRPPTADSPGLTSDLVPPGVTLGAN
jgi:hypothetical protein